MEAAHIAIENTPSTAPTDEPSSLEHAMPPKISSSPEILRCWGRSQVRRICDAAPETVQFRIPHPGLPGEPLVAINKALLGRLSTYYRAAFYSGFSESTQKIFDMDICAVDMHAFRNWLRDGRLTFRWDTIGLEQLVRLYTFADYYDFPALRRTIMTTLVLDKYGDSAGRRLLTYKFENYLSQLPPISPLYQWLARIWAVYIHDHANPYTPPAYRLENETPMVFRTLVHTFRRQARPAGNCRCCYHPCDYHEHQSLQEWKETCGTRNKGIPTPGPSMFRNLSRRP